jgi:phosphoglycerate dehydrogenase-like enzyme
MKKERFKVFVIDSMLNQMVEQAKKNFPDCAPKIDWVLVEKGTEEQLVQKVPGVDILVGARNRVNRKVLEKADKAFFVQQCSAECDNVDIKFAGEKGIKVSNAGGAG